MTKEKLSIDDFTEDQLTELFDQLVSNGKGLKILRHEYGFYFDAVAKISKKLATFRDEYSPEEGDPDPFFEEIDTILSNLSNALDENEYFTYDHTDSFSEEP